MNAANAGEWYLTKTVTTDGIYTWEPPSWDAPLPVTIPLTTYTYTWPSYDDKGRIAIKVARKLVEKKLVDVKPAKQMLDLIDAILEEL